VPVCAWPWGSVGIVSVKDGWYGGMKPCALEKAGTGIA
jgi:hypothetical protein